MAGKVYPDAKAALAGMPFDGMTVMAGGFGLSGNPENLIAALRDNGTRDITIISNNCGADNRGLWVPQSLISRITEIIERPRAFVKTESYAGPDRRRRQTGNFFGPGRRANDPPGTKGFLEPPRQPVVIDTSKPVEKV